MTPVPDSHYGFTGSLWNQITDKVKELQRLGSEGPDHNPMATGAAPPRQRSKRTRSVSTVPEEPTAKKKPMGPPDSRRSERGRVAAPHQNALLVDVSDENEEEQRMLRMSKRATSVAKGAPPVGAARPAPVALQNSLESAMRALVANTVKSRTVSIADPSTSVAPLGTAAGNTGLEIDIASLGSSSEPASVQTPSPEPLPDRVESDEMPEIVLQTGVRPALTPTQSGGRYYLSATMEPIHVLTKIMPCDQNAPQYLNYTVAAVNTAVALMTPHNRRKFGIFAKTPEEVKKIINANVVKAVESVANATTDVAVYFESLYRKLNRGVPNTTQPPSLGSCGIYVVDTIEMRDIGIESVSNASMMITKNLLKAVDYEPYHIGYKYALGAEVHAVSDVDPVLSNPQADDSKLFRRLVDPTVGIGIPPIEAEVGSQAVFIVQKGNSDTTPRTWVVVRIIVPAPNVWQCEIYDPVLNRKVSIEMEPSGPKPTDRIIADYVRILLILLRYIRAIVDGFPAFQENDDLFQDARNNSALVSQLLPLHDAVDAYDAFTPTVDFAYLANTIDLATLADAIFAVTSGKYALKRVSGTDKLVENPPAPLASVHPVRAPIPSGTFISSVPLHVTASIYPDGGNCVMQPKECAYCHYPFIEVLSAGRLQCWSHRDQYPVWQTVPQGYRPDESARVYGCCQLPAIEDVSAEAVAGYYRSTLQEAVNTFVRESREKYAKASRENRSFEYERDHGSLDSLLQLVKARRLQGGSLPYGCVAVDHSTAEQVSWCRAIKRATMDVIVDGDLVVENPDVVEDIVKHVAGPGRVTPAVVGAPRYVIQKTVLAAT